MLKLKLRIEEKGGTDLVEVLMIVALLALGLVGAITFFGDSIDDKTAEVGDAVIRFQGLNGNGQPSNVNGFNSSIGTTQNSNALTGTATNSGQALNLGTPSGYTPTNAADVAVVPANSPQAAALLGLNTAGNSPQNPFGSSAGQAALTGGNNGASANGNRANGSSVFGLNGTGSNGFGAYAANGATSSNLSALANSNAQQSVLSANDIFGIDNAHPILDSAFCQTIRGQRNDPRFSRGSSRSNKKVKALCTNFTDFVAYDYPNGALDQYTADLLACSPSDTSCQRNNALSAALAALGLPPNQGSGNKKALRRIHDIIEDGVCGTNRHGFCDFWATLSRAERIAYFGFNQAQWDNASQFLQIYKDGYRARVRKRQGIVKQAIGVGLSFIPTVGPALSAAWSLGNTIADGGDILGGVINAGLALAGGRIPLGNLGSLPISVNANGLSIGSNGLGLGLSWNGDPSLTVPLGGLGSLSLDDGTLQFDANLGNNASLSLNTDGDANFMIGQNNGNNLSINDQGTIGGQFVSGGSTYGADTTGNLSFNFDDKGNPIGGGLGFNAQTGTTTANLNISNQTQSPNGFTTTNTTALNLANGNNGFSAGLNQNNLTTDGQGNFSRNSFNINGSNNGIDASASIANATNDGQGNSSINSFTAGLNQNGLAGGFNQSSTTTDANGVVQTNNLALNAGANGVGGNVNQSTTDVNGNIINNGLSLDSQGNVQLSTNNTQVDENGDVIDMNGIVVGTNNGQITAALTNQGGQCAFNGNGIDCDKGFIDTQRREWEADLAASNNAEDLAQTNSALNAPMTNENSACGGGANPASGHALGNLPMALLVTATANAVGSIGGGGAMCPSAQLSPATAQQIGSISARLTNTNALSISSDPNGLPQLNAAQFDEINSILNKYSGPMQIPAPGSAEAAQMQTDRERLMDLLAAGGEFQYQDNDNDGVRNFQEDYLAQSLNNTWDGVKDYAHQLRNDPQATLAASADQYKDWALGEVNEFIGSWCNNAANGARCGNNVASAAASYIANNAQDAWNDFQAIDNQCKSGDDSACAARAGAILELQIGAITAGTGLTASAIKNAIPDIPNINTSNVNNNSGSFDTNVNFDNRYPPLGLAGNFDLDDPRLNGLTTNQRDLISVTPEIEWAKTTITDNQGTRDVLVAVGFYDPSIAAQMNSDFSGFQYGAPKLIFDPIGLQGAGGVFLPNANTIILTDNSFRQLQSGNPVKTGDTALQHELLHARVHDEGPNHPLSISFYPGVDSDTFATITNSSDLNDYKDFFSLDETLTFSNDVRRPGNNYPQTSALQGLGIETAAKAISNNAINEINEIVPGKFDVSPNNGRVFFDDKNGDERLVATVNDKRGSQRWDSLSFETFDKSLNKTITIKVPLTPGQKVRLRSDPSEIPAFIQKKLQEGQDAAQKEVFGK